VVSQTFALVAAREGMSVATTYPAVATRAAAVAPTAVSRRPRVVRGLVMGERPFLDVTE
jgi:hypothetical protein